MLTVTIPANELFDEETSSFIFTKSTTLALEHSLVSISKWESKWKKPFLSDKQKSVEEVRDYIRCMTLTQNVDPNVYRAIPKDVYDEIGAYINDSMTATWFTERQNRGPKSRETVTSELIYYWMIAHQIPMECQKWHINRLLTLIRICNIKNEQPKKGKPDLASRAALNASRRAALHTRG